MEEKNTKTARKVYIIYLLYLIAGVVLLLRLIQIQLTYEPHPKLNKYFHPKIRKEILNPDRGAILSHDGRLLAMSLPFYQVYMDCTVMKGSYAEDKKNGAQKEALWMSKADTLSRELAALYGDHSAKWYYELIKNGRENGRQYVKIGHIIDYDTRKKVKSFHLFNEPSNKGGYIEEVIDTRQYPYGSLARRTIGYVKNNRESNNIGLEGKFDYWLHGTDGYFWTKITDGNKKIQDFDSTSRAPMRGYDLRTTINIDIQDIADKAMRNSMNLNPNIYGGCMVIMEVETGAIRAMVNLLRDDKTGHLGESINFAVTKAGEPGSVFKSTTLMSLLEDGFVTIDQEIPNNGGQVPGYEKRFGVDRYITNYERRSGKKTIPIRHALEISSNYAFRYLALKYYGSEPKKMIEKLYRYKLGDEPMVFDIGGLAAPVLPNPENKKYWSDTDLPSVAIGYTVKETPLHILTFYNAIANGGRMMKPYLVESIERGVTVEKQFYPSVLNGSICSRRVADTLRSALRGVVANPKGTGHNVFFDAKLPVAGKTGTAQMVVEKKFAPGGKPVREVNGKRQYQATFVGFFPYDKPKYSIISTMYTVPVAVSNAVYGGNNPARAIREVVDRLYAMDPTFRSEVRKTGHIPTLEDIKQADTLAITEHIDENYRGNTE